MLENLKLSIACLILFGKHPKSIHTNKWLGNIQNQFLKSIIDEKFTF